MTSIIGFSRMPNWRSYSAHNLARSTYVKFFRHQLMSYVLLSDSDNNRVRFRYNTESDSNILGQIQSDKNKGNWESEKPLSLPLSVSSVITLSVAACFIFFSLKAAQGAWPYFLPTQMMDNGDVDTENCPLDLGMLPPWEITVPLADIGKQNIKIPYSDGTHVVGLPLGSDVPKVIAFNYKTLLCMVNGMTSMITNLTLKLERQQKVAARHLEKMSRYRLELEEWKRTVGHGMAVLQDPVSPSKKRKLSTEESGPCDTHEV
ncbi:uncharacterized protein LOC113323932 [Papaver somniferum]|uniref:uncharacterized protein LOC113323932 n=1 Tax=Papaver somniferum TaxID=3469 RepID=UPI000E70427C|nr:uncharacterized protein LOC113323932 [Papaver somniferum]